MLASLLVDGFDLPPVDTVTQKFHAPEPGFYVIQSKLERGREEVVGNGSSVGNAKEVDTQNGDETDVLSSEGARLQVDEKFWAMCTRAYAVYLAGMAKNSSRT